MPTEESCQPRIPKAKTKQLVSLQQPDKESATSLTASSPTSSTTRGGESPDASSMKRPRTNKPVEARQPLTMQYGTTYKTVNVIQHLSSMSSVCEDAAPCRQ